MERGGRSERSESRELPTRDPLMDESREKYDPLKGFENTLVDLEEGDEQEISLGGDVEVRPQSTPHSKPPRDIQVADNVPLPVSFHSELRRTGPSRKEKKRL